MDMEAIARENVKNLKNNTYPGRGIIIGKSPNEKYFYQVYWIMGRSENSRNRVFEQEGSFVKILPYDESKVTDPSLIIYYPARNIKNIHIISNGDQTDTIFNSLEAGKSFEEALFSRTFEPDAPNYTPRISGIIDLDSKNDGYALSILKSENNNSDYCKRLFYYYEKAVPGFGHCLHTYEGDGNPIPSFNGEPYLVNLFDNCEETAEYYWNIINKENKVALMVKQIDTETKSFKTIIKNRYVK